MNIKFLNFTNINRYVNVIDIFILFFSILPFIFMLSFSRSWAGDGIALLCLQVAFMIIFTVLVMSYPQLNNHISRVMIVWTCILSFYLGITLLLHWRPVYYGASMVAFRWFRNIVILVLSHFICKFKCIKNILSRLKQIDFI